MALATTDQQYYENPEHWGENAFVTLEDIIDNIILTADDDSYFKHIKRFRASIFGKLGLKKLEVDIKSDDKAISFDLAPSKIFPYPRYMTNWSRISVLNSCGNLQVLNISNRAQVKDYLQDHEYELMYDCNGSVLTGNDFNPKDGDCCVKIQCEESSDDCGCTDNKFKDSWVKDIKEGSYFEFSDDLVDETIVIEFQSAGLSKLEDCDIKVHHHLEMAIMRFIQWNLLMGKRNTPKSEWKEYQDLFKSEKTRSKRLLADKITVERIMESIALRY